MEVWWFEVSITSISSVPDCVTLTTMPVASETYSKLCAEPVHFPADCTPFLRKSGGVGSREPFERTRFKPARITAQSCAACELAEGFPEECAGPAAVGT